MIRLQIFSEQGTLIQDLSFDLVQFIRGAFILVTTISILAFILVLQSDRKYLKQVFIISLIAWSIPVAFSYYQLLSVKKMPNKISNHWIGEVTEEIGEESDKIYAMISDKSYPGQLLSAREVGLWWTNCSRADGTGIVMTKEHQKRGELLKHFFEKTTIHEHEQIIRILGDEDIDYLIATPKNIKFFNELSNHNLVKRKSDSSWLFDPS